MRVVRNGGAMAAIALLCACGGEGAPTPSPSAPTASLNTVAVTPDANPISILSIDGFPTRVSFSATLSAAPNSGFYASIDLGNAPLTLVGAPTLSGNKVTYTVETKPNPGLFGGTVVAPLRICSNASCSAVYPGSSSQIELRYDVKVSTWSSREQTATTTGYVPTRFDASRGKLSNLVFEDGTNFQNIVASDDAVFATSLRGDCGPFGGGAPLSGALRKLSFDGATVWTKTIPDVCIFGQPVFHRNRLVVPTSYRGKPAETLIIDPANGNVLHSIPGFPSSAGSPAGEYVYYASSTGTFSSAGSTAVTVSAYDPVAGKIAWSRETAAPTYSGAFRDQSIAVEEQFLHLDLGYSFLTVSRSDGVPVRQIELGRCHRTVPNGCEAVSYPKSPLVDKDGNVFLSSDVGPLYRINAGASTVAWGNNFDLFDGRPALADGKLYAQRENSKLINVIDPATGANLSELIIDPARTVSNWNGPKAGLFVTSDYIVIGRGQFIKLGTFALIDRETGAVKYVYENTGPHFILTPGKTFVSVGSRAVSFHTFAP